MVYVSLGYKVRPRTFECVATGTAVLFILRPRLLVYSAGSGMNRVQVVCLEEKILCRFFALLNSCLCV